jgi:hypothetical protein
MSNPLLNKQFVAETAINQFRIVKFGSTDDFVVQGAAVGDALIGICNFIAPAAGERVDIILAGIGEVQLGGTVARGGLVTSNATGQGVAAAPAAGTNNNVIGRALMSGVSGDVIKVLVNPGSVQG